jgi:hypothetical protein
MGWSFSNCVTFQHQGQPTAVHPDGNNVAWVCPKCSHAVLFTYQNGGQALLRRLPRFARGVPIRTRCTPRTGRSRIAVGCDRVVTSGGMRLAIDGLSELDAAVRYAGWPRAGGGERDL